MNYWLRVRKYFWAPIALLLGSSNYNLILMNYGRTIVKHIGLNQDYQTLFIQTLWQDRSKPLPQQSPQRKKSLRWHLSALIAALPRPGNPFFHCGEIFLFLVLIQTGSKSFSCRGFASKASNHLEPRKSSQFFLPCCEISAKYETCNLSLFPLRLVCHQTWDLCYKTHGLYLKTVINTFPPKRDFSKNFEECTAPK